MLRITSNHILLRLCLVGHLAYFISIYICKCPKMRLGQVYFQVHSHSITEWTNFEEYFRLFHNRPCYKKKN